MNLDEVPSWTECSSKELKTVLDIYSERADWEQATVIRIRKFRTRDTVLVVDHMTNHAGWMGMG